MNYLYNKNRNIWLKYIKAFEVFNAKIPSDLKELFIKIRILVGEQKDSFIKTINLSELSYGDISIIIDVDFAKILSGKETYDKKDIIYYSNLNIYELLDLNSKIINIPIIIKDIEINQDKLFSVISHEIRHIYDFYDINNDEYNIIMDSFIKSFYYNKMNKDEFNYFLYLVYLSLEHELIARNTMIWNMFINSNCSKEELYKLFKDSFIYDSFNLLDNFNYTKIIKEKNIIERINNFINIFGGEICYDNSDILLFFNNWNNYFKEKSEEYKIEGFRVLDDLYNINEKYYFKKEKINIKEFLLNIHKNYIFPDKYKKD